MKCLCSHDRGDHRVRKDNTSCLHDDCLCHMFRRDWGDKGIHGNPREDVQEEFACSSR